LRTRVEAELKGLLRVHVPVCVKELMDIIHNRHPSALVWEGLLKGEEA
jgi:hypothetical protein